MSTGESKKTNKTDVNQIIFEGEIIKNILERDGNIITIKHYLH